MKDESVKTNRDLFCMVHSYLKEKYPTYESACKILDYTIPSPQDEPLYTELTFPEVIAQVTPGAYNGLYIDWYLRYESFEEPVKIGALETLRDDPEAYGLMGLISGYLIYATKRCIKENDANFVSVLARGREVR